MLNPALKVAGLFFLLTFVLPDADRPQKTTRAQVPAPSAVKVETREYRAGNGHTLAVTSLGSFVRLGGPRRAGAEGAPIRDGYRVTYKHPLDGRQVVASTAAGVGGGGASGASDFVPVSFEAPADGAVLSVGETLTAKVTVRTKDGLLRLTHLLTWKPDADSLSVRTEITNSGASQAVSAVAFARTLDVSGKGTKAAIRGVMKRDPQTNALFVMRCHPNVDCPPPPPIGPYRVQGDPSPLIQTAGATGASLTWDLPLSAQAPASVTIQLAPQDVPLP